MGGKKIRNTKTKTKKKIDEKQKQPEGGSMKKGKAQGALTVLEAAPL